ncbi:hypothetical protein [Allopontixanthobacter sediminis]|uniref:MarR family transcriptional regulator n=1 Tax=Allopontixanthobacter sediminis TaxID=1689985 RepID=A0A845AYS6_9SPHN|nr:hypothetical protein [Allopontixanthobacter sediminis]MXP43425.1 hypothetical protein [Allopontixanthobacter sediminis]
MSGPDALTSARSAGERGEMTPDSPGEATPRAAAVHYFRRTLAMRRHRDKRFGKAFTTDRGWDLLLLLMIARLESRTTNAGEIFEDESAHGVTIEELDRQIGLGNVVLMDAGNDLERSKVVLTDEAARHLIDLYRIDTAAAAE